MPRVKRTIDQLNADFAEAQAELQKAVAGGDMAAAMKWGAKAQSAKNGLDRETSTTTRDEIAPAMIAVGEAVHKFIAGSKAIRDAVAVGVTSGTFTLQKIGANKARNPLDVDEYIVTVTTGRRGGRFEFVGGIPVDTVEDDSEE